MISLYSFGSNFGVMDPSPFVVKVDVFFTDEPVTVSSQKRCSLFKKSLLKVNCLLLLLVKMRKSYSLLTRNTLLNTLQKRIN